MGYDVFLSHNAADKAGVEVLATWLLENTDIVPFLDIWCLVPGEPWQEAIENALRNSTSCAVCIGPSGLGPWENMEMRAFLDQSIQQRTLRVIPVTLPGAPSSEKMGVPLFLKGLTWVDFRNGFNEEACARFVAGIKGQQPGSDPARKFLPANIFYLRKNIYQIVLDTLQKNNISLPLPTYSMDCSFVDLVRQIQNTHPELTQDYIDSTTRMARSKAYDIKYSSRSEDTDERYANINSWNKEFLTVLLRSANVQSKKSIQSKNILNVGIGVGLEGKGVYDEFHNFIGADISGESLGRAHRIFPRMRCVANDAEKLRDIGTGTVDLYISLRTFQSTLLDINLSMHECRRVLRSGGSFLISIPNKYLVDGKLLEGLPYPGSTILDLELPYVYVERVRKAARRAGFSNIGVLTGIYEIYIWGRC